MEQSRQGLAVLEEPELVRGAAATVFGGFRAVDESLSSIAKDPNIPLEKRFEAISKQQRENYTRLVILTILAIGGWILYDKHSQKAA